MKKEKHNVNVRDIPEPLHRKMRIKAASIEGGLSMNKAILAALEAWVKEETEES